MRVLTILFCILLMTKGGARMRLGTAPLARLPIFTARCYASAVFAVMQCLSVCPSVRLSVTFVDHVKTNKHIIDIISPSGSETILVFFSYQWGCRYSDGNSPNGGVECKGV